MKSIELSLDTARAMFGKNEEIAELFLSNFRPLIEQYYMIGTNERQ